MKRANMQRKRCRKPEIEECDVADIRRRIPGESTPCSQAARVRQRQCQPLFSKDGRQGRISSLSPNSSRERRYARVFPLDAPIQTRISLRSIFRSGRKYMPLEDGRIGPCLSGKALRYGISFTSHYRAWTHNVAKDTKKGNSEDSPQRCKYFPYKKKDYSWLGRLGWTILTFRLFHYHMQQNVECLRLYGKIGRNYAKKGNFACDASIYLESLVQFPLIIKECFSVSSALRKSKNFQSKAFIQIFAEEYIIATCRRTKSLELLKVNFALGQPRVMRNIHKYP